MAKKSRNTEDLEKKLAEFQSRSVTPTSAIMNPVKKDDKTSEPESSDEKEIKEESELKVVEQKVEEKDVTKEEEEVDNIESKTLSDLVKGKTKLEDTHTRRTFLVRNDLLKRLDEIAEKTNNRSFKTDFINYVIKRGLDELDEL